MAEPFNIGAKTERQLSKPWRRALSASRPAWARGPVPLVALAILSSADLVMLSVAYGQSFGSYGYVVCLATLAALVVLPAAIAHLLWDVVSDARKQGVRLLEAVRASAAHAVKMAAVILLSAALVGMFVAVTYYRLDQSRINDAQTQQRIEQEEQLRQESDTIDGYQSDSDSTSASDQAQTLVLTVIIAVTAAYSFAVRWASCSGEDSEARRKVEAIGAEYPGIAATAAHDALTESMRREPELLEESARAASAVHAWDTVVKAMLVTLAGVKGPEELPHVAETIKELAKAAKGDAAPDDAKESEEPKGSDEPKGPDGPQGPAAQVPEAV